MNHAVISLFCLVSYFTKEVESVQGCSVFFDSDFKWKRAMCDSELVKLTVIPKDLPDNLVELRILHQTIAVITNHGLKHLRNLERLEIESSGVQTITPDAFQGLISLKYLSLQNNSIRLGQTGLSTQTLRHVKQLEVLNLAKNPIDIIPDLFFAAAGTSKLRQLDLSRSTAFGQKIAPRAFTSLYNLELLDLSAGRMRALDGGMADVLDSMPNLAQFYLGSNPWHCDCSLRWLREWQSHKYNLRVIQYQSIEHGAKNSTIQPICFSPPVMKSSTIFTYPSAGASTRGFNCTPKILTEGQVFNVSQGDTLQLSCTFYAEPIGSILWYRNRQRVRQDQIYPQPGSNLVVETHFTSEINLTFNEARLNETVSCEFVSETGRPVSTTFSVLYLDSFLLDARTAVSFGWNDQQGWIYIGTGVGVLLLVFAALAFGIFHCCDPRNRSGPSLLNKVEEKSLNQVDANAIMHDDTDKRSAGDTPIYRSTLDNEIKASSPVAEFGSPVGSMKSPVKVDPSFAYRSAIPENGRNSPLAVLRRPNANVVQLAGTLLPDPTSNRLFVSCDGPEPTVLLAAGLLPSKSTQQPSANLLQTTTGSSILASSSGFQPIFVNAPFSNPNSTFKGPITLISDQAGGPDLFDLMQGQTCSGQKSNLQPCPIHGDIVLTDDQEAKEDLVFSKSSAIPVSIDAYRPGSIERISANNPFTPTASNARNADQRRSHRRLTPSRSSSRRGSRSLLLAKDDFDDSNVPLLKQKISSDSYSPRRMPQFDSAIQPVTYFQRDTGSDTIDHHTRSLRRGDQASIEQDFSPEHFEGHRRIQRSGTGRLAPDFLYHQGSCSGEETWSSSATPTSPSDIAYSNPVQPDVSDYVVDPNTLRRGPSAQRKGMYGHSYMTHQSKSAGSSSSCLNNYGTIGHLNRNEKYTFSTLPTRSGRQARYSGMSSQQDLSTYRVGKTKLIRPGSKHKLDTDSDCDNDN